MKPNSELFVPGEFIAVRDDATGPFYVAEIQDVSPRTLRVHYYEVRVRVRVRVMLRVRVRVWVSVRKGKGKEG